MTEKRYEIVEQDKQVRDQTMSMMMGKHLVQGIAYFCLVEAGKPMSPTDMTNFLQLKDQSYTESFKQAILDLVAKGLVREITKKAPRSSLSTATG